MGRRLLFLSIAFATLCSAAPVANAQNDRVRTSKGTESGEVTKVSATEVTVSKGSVSKQIPVSEIESVQFGDEPSELRQARVNARNGDYRSALDTLRAVNVRDIANPFVQKELEFYKAYSQAKLALMGEGDVAAAGRDLNTFAKQNKQNHHYFQAMELLGDLLVAAGRYGPAERMYLELAKAPFPVYKARAAVLVGQALQGQDKHAEAIEKFDAALRIVGDAPEGKSQSLAAKLGKAVSLSASGDVDAGVAAVQAVLRDAEPEQDQLLATAYAALGSCYLKAGREKDALFAYLHVDLLFANVPELHAEALFHLASLWESTGKPQQAREARATLKQRYASSSWAQKL